MPDFQPSVLSQIKTESPVYLRDNILWGGVGAAVADDGGPEDLGQVVDRHLVLQDLTHTLDR